MLVVSTGCQHRGQHSTTRDIAQHTRLIITTAYQVAGQAQHKSPHTLCITCCSLCLLHTHRRLCGPGLVGRGDHHAAADVQVALPQECVLDTWQVSVALCCVLSCVVLCLSLHLAQAYPLHALASPHCLVLPVAVCHLSPLLARSLLDSHETAYCTKMYGKCVWAWFGGGV